MVSGWRLDPLRGVVTAGGTFPTWSERQMRLPEYLRLDLSVRAPFDWNGLGIEPYLSLLNVTGRQNVMYYALRFEQGPDGPLGASLQPRLQLPIPVAFPSLGLDIRF